MTALEVAAVTTVVVVDFIQPTLVILVLVVISLLIRREGPRSLGFVRPRAPGRLVAWMAGFAFVWTMVHLLVFMPVLERITGTRQDMSSFATVEGNLAVLAAMLALSWSVAAVGEETAYRGFTLSRISELIPDRWRAWVPVVASSVLFGLAHTEQGIVGVSLSLIDGLAYAVIRLHTGTLWASVLAHGFINTIGFVAFYFVGPVYGLW